MKKAVKKVTIKEIAEQAGVSAGTVSNALNNRAGMVSEDKREEIIEIAKRMGYFKKGKRTGVLRLVIFRGTQQVVGDTVFFSELIEGIEQSCRRHDYTLTIHYAHNIEMDILGKLDDPAGSDGILFLGTEMTLEDIKRCKRSRIPFVIVDNAYIQQDVSFVAINNRDAMYEMCMKLIEKGHTRIGLINSTSQINNFKERKLGFLQAMNDANLPVLPEYEMFVSPIRGQAAADTEAFLQSMIEEGGELPTAYMAVNDEIALGAWETFQKLGMGMVLTGFDHLPSVSLLDPPLPTIEVNRAYLGSLAMNSIGYSFKHPEFPASKFLAGTKLVNIESIKQIN